MGSFFFFTTDTFTHISFASSDTRPYFSSATFMHVFLSRAPMHAFFESARVVMVTVRKWGGVSLGGDYAPAETGRRYKTNWMSVLRREK